MIAREFPDTVPGIVQKITSLAQTLGKEHRVFNATDNFAEVGLEFENPGKGSNMLLMQALRVAEGVQLTCSPWVKSWKGSRMVVPNLAQDEAMAFIRTVFVPALEDLYPQMVPQPIPDKSLLKSFLEIFHSIWKRFASLFANVGVLGLWIFFIFLVFILPRTRPTGPVELEPKLAQSISACFCQQVLEVDSVMKVPEEQFKACAAKYVCVGNAKASCLLQVDRQWNTCEF
jgi:hypothetical protein